jgi:hypothetical protein
MENMSEQNKKQSERSAHEKARSELASITSQGRAALDREIERRRQEHLKVLSGELPGITLPLAKNRKKN